MWSCNISVLFYYLDASIIQNIARALVFNDVIQKQRLAAFLEASSEISFFLSHGFVPVPGTRTASDVSSRDTLLSFLQVKITAEALGSYYCLCDWVCSVPWAQLDLFMGLLKNGNTTSKLKRASFIKYKDYLFHDVLQFLKILCFQKPQIPHLKDNRISFRYFTDTSPCLFAKNMFFPCCFATSP